MWCEPERVRVQNMEQLHAHDCPQNVTEPQATEYHTKTTLVHNTGTVSKLVKTECCIKACCPEDYVGSWSTLCNHGDTTFLS